MPTIGSETLHSTLRVPSPLPLSRAFKMAKRGRRSGSGDTVHHEILSLPLSDAGHLSVCGDRKVT